jgi:hypothetical protein
LSVKKNGLFKIFHYFCGMSKKPLQTEHKKWERIYESEDSICIWKYDTKISNINPYQIEIKNKPNRLLKSR